MVDGVFCAGADLKVSVGTKRDIFEILCSHPTPCGCIYRNAQACRRLKSPNFCTICGRHIGSWRWVKLSLSWGTFLWATFIQATRLDTSYSNHCRDWWRSPWRRFRNGTFLRYESCRYILKNWLFLKSTFSSTILFRCKSQDWITRNQTSNYTRVSDVLM
jgi:hypothetical protein